MSAPGVPATPPPAPYVGDEGIREPLLGRPGDVAQQDGQSILFNLFLGMTPSSLPLALPPALPLNPPRNPPPPSLSNR